MEPLRRLQGFEQYKIVSDPRRQAILRLLMVEPATLSQLGHSLGDHPARVRHHLKILEKAGLVELVDTRVVRGFVEKYYCSKAQSFLLQELLLPAGATAKTVIIMGSHDMALDLATKRLREEQGLDFLVVPVGSLEGLVALRQGHAHLAGCHLVDACSGEYNRPYVEHLFPEGNMRLFTLAHRQQGLLLAPGNPQQIQSLGDLTREDVNFINRNRGSGTRLWIDHHLQQLEIKPQQVQGYRQEVRTHTAVATAVLDGQASVGVGLYAAARQAGLDFIPLFQERFDLVLSQEMAQSPRLLPLLEYLRGDEFFTLLKELGGYDASQTGEMVDL